MHVCAWNNPCSSILFPSFLSALSPGGPWDPPALKTPPGPHLLCVYVCSCVCVCVCVILHCDSFLLQAVAMGSNTFFKISQQNSPHRNVKLILYCYFICIKTALWDSSHRTTSVWSVILDQMKLKWSHLWSINIKTESDGGGRQIEYYSIKMMNSLPIEFITFLSNLLFSLPLYLALCLCYLLYPTKPYPGAMQDWIPP